MVHYTTFTNLRVTGDFDADNAFNASALPVTATGSTTARTLAARFGEVFNIRDFGAVGTGVADDYTKINLAFAALQSAGGGTVYIPPGNYYITGELALPDVPFAVRGAGMDASRIIMSGANHAFWRSSGATLIEGAEFSDFSVVGAWGGPLHTDTSLQTDGGKYPFLLGKIDWLRMRNIGVDYSKTMSMAFRRCHRLDVDGCRIRYSARDGISAGTCNYVRICNNTIDHCGDDGIAVHSTDLFLPVRQTTLISNNRLRDSYGINVLGAMKCSITDNVLDLCTGHGVSVSYVDQEGNVGPVGLNITDNIITDLYNKFSVDAVLNQLNYITVQPQTASAGDALTVAPGENVTATGVIQTPYPYFYSEGDDANVERTGGYDITIANNQCLRTRNIGDTYSTATGFGSSFSRNGWYDFAFTEAILNTGTAIQLGKLAGSDMRNVLLTGNRVRGISTAIGMSGTRYENVEIKGNQFLDFSAYGVNLGAGSHTITLADNLFDGDPFLLSTNRHASTKGAWQNTTTPCAVNLGGDGVTVQRNNFRNLSNITASSGKVYQRNNLIYCDFAVAGYSATNLGVGNLPAVGDQYWYAYQISDSTSATWNDISNYCVHESASMPSTGKYLMGMFVWARGNLPSTSGYLLGWKRLTTGTGHVLATDWAEVSVPVVDVTNSRMGVGVTPSVTAHFKRSDSATGAMMRVEQGSTGDASLTFMLTGVKNWAMGIDNSDSDKFKIGDGDNGFTSPVIAFTPTTFHAELFGPLKLPVLTAAPAALADGTIAYADGTSWNPGSGAGFYGYVSGAWTKL